MSPSRKCKLCNKDMLEEVRYNTPYYHKYYCLTEADIFNPYKSHYTHYKLINCCIDTFIFEDLTINDNGKFIIVSKTNDELSQLLKISSFKYDDATRLLDKIKTLLSFL